jgi:hypothetical protein
MISSLQSVDLRGAGLISAPSQDGKQDGKRSGGNCPLSPQPVNDVGNYDNFTKMNLL